MTLRVPVLVFASALLAAGCGAAAPPDAGGAASVDTVAGVTELTYGSGRVTALPWTFDTVAVLGDALGDTTQQFDQVPPSGLAGDAAGNLYLLDASGPRVLEYGPGGHLVASFGRGGGGPGEMGSPVALAVGPGDSVWITDLGNSRTEIFPPGGGDSRSIAFDLRQGMPGFDLSVQGGSVIQSVRQLRFGPPGGAPGSDSAQAGIPIRRYDPSGNVLVTLWTAPRPEMNLVRAGGGRNVMAAPRAFEPRLRWAAFDDGGIVVSDSASYVLHLIAPEGTERLRIRRGPPPRATTDADREAERQRIRDQAENGGGGGVRISVQVGGGGTRVSAGSGAPSMPPPEEMIKARIENTTFADVIPRITGLRVDPRGRIWVGVSENEPEAVDRIDVYTRDGKLLGELRGVPVPDAFMGPDRAALLTRDDMDVQHVVLLKLGGQGA